MSKHVGHDHALDYRFHIVSIDRESQTVAIRYERTAWLRGTEITEELSCTDFLEALTAGRFEVRPAE